MLENENNFVFEKFKKKKITHKNVFPYPHEHFWGIKQSMWNFKKSKTTDIMDHHTTKRGENNKFFLTLMLNKGEIQIFKRKQNPLTSYISESFFFFNYQNQKAS